LPTWYEIRVTREAYAARAGRVDIMVAMNAETYQKDVREVASGGYLIYDATWPRSALLQRGDITVIGVPLAQLVNENFDGVRNRILLKNIAYAGVIAALLDLDLEHHRRIDEGELRQEAQAARLEHQGAAPGLRLREAALRLPAAAARRADG
jgi:2-oxoglutarate ferredoxin oxidoreductase subunit alpha